MGEFLRTWWPVLLLVYLPSLTQGLASVWVTRAFRKLDESHPDNMPYTAGEWLGKEIERLGLQSKLEAIVTDDAAKISIDGYHPEHGVIQLRADTYFKRDPMHWAIGAHELGHARFHLAMPILGRFIISMVYVKNTLVWIATALMFGNVLFALPHVTALALTLFECALVLQTLVLLDEAVASTLAVRSLRMWPEIQDTQMRSARRALRIAFATYLIHFATRALMLTQWHLVEEHTRVPAVPPVYLLTSFGTFVAALVTFVLTMYALERLFRLFQRRTELPTKREALRAFVAQLAQLVFMYLVWNHRADSTWAYCVMAAIIPISGWLLIVLALPGSMFYALIVQRYLRKWTVDRTHRTRELQQDHAAGMRTRHLGNLAFDQLVERSYAEPAFERRVRELLLVAYVPLLVLFWLA